jgi:hypothetical protein
VKGAAAIDWSDPEARQQFLTEVVVDARRLWRLAHDLLHTLAEEDGRAVREAKERLGEILLQDVEEHTGSGGKPEAKLKEGTAKDRIPSPTDPEQRHGHKSKHRRFTGHKAAIAVDIDSQLIVDADVLAGNAGDATGLLEQVERVEAQLGQPVARLATMIPTSPRDTMPTPMMRADRVPSERAASPQPASFPTIARSVTSSRVPSMGTLAS